ncbi:N-acetyltransferase [Actinoplanes sp. OR16]|uniref:GNAT family N-acetyltransferase n=1 Tax=Actinoplanes sp. OR16 TaxID=946334 RepID=UPI000F710AEA|nr:GNAT family N-acetyltransferase [Actinoplanes sp. OR16]BBH68669.1 N-acetyltransferase [Actinoplanes sp. OR16]
MFSVRPAVPADAEGLAEVHVRTWQAAYRGLMPQAFLDGLSVASRAATWRGRLDGIAAPRAVLVLDPGVSGFVTVGPGSSPSTGHLFAIYVLPSLWGTGGGRQLMEAGVASLTASGFTSATLWVLSGNVRARRFYEAAGWHADGATLVDDSNGFPLHEIRYRRAL